MPNTITDITYGIPAEVWPRDYSKVEASLMFWRKEQIPVKVTMPSVLHVRSGDDVLP